MSHASVLLSGVENKAGGVASGGPPYPPLLKVCVCGGGGVQIRPPSFQREVVFYINITGVDQKPCMISVQSLPVELVY